MCVVCVLREEVLIRSGGDLLSRVLGRSTIGSEELNFRVRDGIGCSLFDITTGNNGLRVLACVESAAVRCPFGRAGETAIRNPNPGCERLLIVY